MKRALIVFAAVFVYAFAGSAAPATDAHQVDRKKCSWPWRCPPIPHPHGPDVPGPHCGPFRPC